MLNVQRQLPLGMTLKDDATFDNFYPGKNVEIVSTLKEAIGGQAEKIIYLCATRGTGCSHLLQASCNYAYQNNMSSVYLPFENLSSLSPEVLIGLESLQLVCIDDLDVVAGHPEWEEALFHLFNRIFDAGGKIIFAAHDLPKAINLGLPDLVSRLSWGVVFQLHSLSDDEKLSALIMRAKRRGFTLPEDVARYILTHCPRHMGTLFAALDVLDKASLVTKRRFTIPFIKEVLEI